MATRSQRLAVGKTLTAGVVIVYTVPAGLNTILKSVFVQNVAEVTQGLSVFISNPATSAAVTLIESGVARLQIADWQGWVVLEEADRLGVYSDVGNISYWASGAELVSTQP